MRDFHFILMDLDDTVLDFHKAEHESLIKTLREYGYELTEEDVARYSAINAWHWKQLELGVFTREQVLIGRFARFLLTLGSDADAEAVCRRYEYGLRFEPHLMPGAKDCLTALKAAGKQLYAVSNGSTAVQESRLALSGLDARAAAMAGLAAASMAVESEATVNPSMSELMLFRRIGDLGARMLGIENAPSNSIQPGGESHE